MNSVMVDLNESLNLLYNPPNGKNYQSLWYLFEFIFHVIREIAFGILRKETRFSMVNQWPRAQC